MLHCGAAKAGISPDLPINLAGYRNNLVSEKVHDDLHVVALFFKNGKNGKNGKSANEQSALLTYDLIDLDAEFVAEVQQKCSEATGIPARSVLTSASHSHSTPSIMARRFKPDSPQLAASQQFRQRVIERSVKALTDAQQRAEPCAVLYNTARIRENLNRRAFFPSGQYFYQPKQKNLLPLCDGIVDEELGIVFFKAAKEDRFIATLVNYTSHPLTIGDTSTEVSADFPGVLKREIERNLGCVASFINGACGDNHPLGAEAGLARCERMGLALAEKVLYHRWDAVALDNPSVAAETHDIVLPALTKQQHDALPQNFAYPYRAPDKKKLVDGGLPAAFSLLAIGPLLFVGVPGEVTAEWGLRLKWESPFPKTFVMFLATNQMGYIPHRNAYAWGGYEVLTSRFAPRASTILCNKVLDAAEVLCARIEAKGTLLHLPGATEGAVPANAPGAAKRNGKKKKR